MAYTLCHDRTRYSQTCLSNIEYLLSMEKGSLFLNKNKYCGSFFYT